MVGSGFRANCSSCRQPYNVTTTDQGFKPIEVFVAELVYNMYASPTTASLNVVYKPDAGCVGELILTNCNLTAGPVQYSVLVDGPGSTISLDPATTTQDDKPIGDPDSLDREGYTQGTRELIFRTAVAVANSSETLSVQALSSGDHFIYQTYYLFMALGTLFLMLAFFAILFTFYGFWEIGRPVSMSPIETAKAFNAPVLTHGDSNAPASNLLKQVGNQPVRYGVVHAPAAEEHRPPMSWSCRL